MIEKEEIRETAERSKAPQEVGITEEMIAEVINGAIKEIESINRRLERIEKEIMKKEREPSRMKRRETGEGIRQQNAVF